VKTSSLSSTDWKSKDNLAKFRSDYFGIRTLGIAIAPARWRTARFEVNSPTL
jgi:hypothetical protein